MKVATIVGTRPELIRLSRVIAALDNAVEHVLVHTGQNYDYELNQVFFDELEIRAPDFFLGAAGNSAAATIGQIISQVDTLLRESKPDAVLILGDTNSCLSAIPAKRLKIPVFHMEAGNRCFDQRVPEEINRRIVDHISDINLPYSDISREYLLREGIPPDRVIKTGSPMYEVLHYYLPKIKTSKILSRLNLRPQEFFVVSAHREENIDSPVQFTKLMSLLNRLAETYGLPIVLTTHPRTRNRINEYNESADAVLIHDLVHLAKPFGLCDYVHLEMNAKTTLSDSGTISEESSILGFSAINIRDAHERPEAMEEAVVMMTGLDWRRIHDAFEVLLMKSDAKRSIVDDYEVPNVSEKVVRIILSYTDYVNQYVWHKNGQSAP